MSLPKYMAAKTKRLKQDNTDCKYSEIYDLTYDWFLEAMHSTPPIGISLNLIIAKFLELNEDFENWNIKTLRSLLLRFCQR